jgi:hypothetical protein
MDRLGPLGLLLALAAIPFAACQEPDPNYGDPNGIVGKKLPNEQSVAATGATNAQAPTTTLKAAHGSDAGVAGGAPLDSVPDCLGCHTGSGAAPKFAFGGRVENSGNGVADAVVSVTGLTAVKTDADGYFWEKDGDVAAGANASVTSGTNPPAAMGGALQAGAAGGGCLGSNCHKGSQGPIHP